MAHGPARNLRKRVRSAVPAALLALASAAVPAFAETAPWQGTMELSLGRYNIADPLFDAIYQPGGSIKGFGLSANLIPHLDFYLDVKALTKKGLLSHSGEETSFVLVPISLGLRGSARFVFFRPFLGLGLDYFIYFENNPIGTVVNYAKGWHATGGLYLEFSDSFPLLPFFKVKHSSVKATAGARTIDLGGWEVGGGLAVAF